MSKRLVLAAYDFVFDVLVARVRVLLFPFYVAGRAWSLLVRALWSLRNEFLKTRMKRCGHGVRIHGRFEATGLSELVIGDNVHINQNAYLRAEGGLSIGDNTHISRNLVIYTINHDHAGTLLPYDAGTIAKPVSVGKNVWIGINVSIVPGVVIGDGAIIGMGTVVSKDVPPLAVVGSVAPRVIRERDAEQYERLDGAGSYSGMSGRPYRGR